MAASSTSGKVSTVRGLGEIALRIENLDAMQKFYEDLALNPERPGQPGGRESQVFRHS
jgi:hypothetical protein